MQATKTYRLHVLVNKPDYVSVGQAQGVSTLARLPHPTMPQDNMRATGRVTYVFRASKQRKATGPDPINVTD